MKYFHVGRGWRMSWLREAELIIASQRQETSQEATMSGKLTIHSGKTNALGMPAVWS